jgi:hypothetical protein
MTKIFDYNNDNNEMNRIANEIINLLNEYNLEQPYISGIISRVEKSLIHSVAKLKLSLPLLDEDSKWSLLNILP